VVSKVQSPQPPTKGVNKVKATQYYGGSAQEAVAGRESWEYLNKASRKAEKMIKPDTGTVASIPLADIQPGNNDRQAFDSVAIAELAESMQAHGLAQPITVRPLASGLYEIVAGERRFRAAQSINWPAIPAIVRALTDEQASAIMLAENVHRVDLNPIDEAKAYQKRIDQFAWTNSQVATNANVSTARVNSRLALLAFSWEVQSLIKSGSLTLGYAEVMEGLDNNRQIIALRYFSQSKRPTLAEYRALCAKLLQAQAQESLFDISIFEQRMEDVKQRTGPKQWHYPVNEKLPAMRPANSIGKMLEDYMGLLLTSNNPEYKQAGEIVSLVYKGLASAGLARAPKSPETMTR
jgi:ParB family chromosome partitioning protein